jgi:DNA-binding GntR family transcriptional regulator
MSKPNNSRAKSRKPGSSAIPAAGPGIPMPSQRGQGEPLNPDLADRARFALEDLIVTLELEPGSRWSELQLSDRIGIGRTPVREALQRLEADSLVRILPRQGVEITEVNVAHQMLMLEVRRVLERLIAQGAASRAAPSEREALLHMADRLESLAAGDILPFLHYHYEIKRFLAMCARNPYAGAAIAPMHAMSRRFYFLHYRLMHDMPLAAGLHAAVLRAVAVGEAAQATAAADRLMDYVEDLTRDTVLQRDKC